MKNRRKKSSFTLIEMLAVIAIIAILIGIVFRLAALVGEKSARAMAVEDLENMKFCLEAYYAVYGQYPPTSTMIYESGHSQDGGKYPPDWEVLVETVRQFHPDFNLHPKGKGLVYYLMADYGQRLVPSFTDPKSANWREYFKKVGYECDGGTGCVYHPSGFELQSFAFSNMVFTIEDTWDEAYIYESLPPYQSYRLYSAGPDRAPNTVDDIGRDEWVE